MQGPCQLSQSFWIIVDHQIHHLDVEVEICPFDCCWMHQSVSSSSCAAKKSSQDASCSQNVSEDMRSTRSCARNCYAISCPVFPRGKCDNLVRGCKTVKSHSHKPVSLGQFHATFLATISKHKADFVHDFAAHWADLLIKHSSQTRTGFAISNWGMAQVLVEHSSQKILTKTASQEGFSIRLE
jgi:hypothetical protein